MISCGELFICEELSRAFIHMLWITSEWVNAQLRAPDLKRLFTRTQVIIIHIQVYHYFLLVAALYWFFFLQYNNTIKRLFCWPRLPSSSAVLFYLFARGYSLSASLNSRVSFSFTSWARGSTRNEKTKMRKQTSKRERKRVWVCVCVLGLCGFCFLEEDSPGWTNEGDLEWGLIIRGGGAESGRWMRLYLCLGMYTGLYSWRVCKGAENEEPIEDSSRE